MNRKYFYLIILLFTLIFNINTFAYTRPVIRYSLLSWSSYHAYCSILDRQSKEKTIVFNSTLKDTIKIAKQNKIWAKKIIKKLKLNKMSKKKSVYKICNYIDDQFSYNEKIRWVEYAIKTKEANCTAYADLFYILCKARKIPVRYVIGMANGIEISSHCWNQVKINKKWYWVDTCWSYRPSKKLWKNHYKIKEIW